MTTQKEWHDRVNKLAHFLAKQEGWKIKSTIDLGKEVNPRAMDWFRRAREILEFLDDSNT